MLDRFGKITTSRRGWLMLGVACVLALSTLIGVGAYLRTGAVASDTSAVPIGGPFRLTDQHGERVEAADFAGRWMLVYFGYTYCPDICPTTLANMTAALDELPAEVAEEVVPVFITVDPSRDTVEQMATYAPLFHPRLVALTGTDAETKAAARAYRVYFKKAGEGDSYLVDHSTFVYLMDPEGNYRAHFGHDAGPEDIATRIEQEASSS